MIFHVFVADFTAENKGFQARESIKDKGRFLVLTNPNDFQRFYCGFYRRKKEYKGVNYKTRNRPLSFLYNKGKNNYLVKVYLGYAIKYIGYSLHPIQDKYAHTAAVSKWKVTAGIGYWSHLDYKDVDTANKHIYAIYKYVSNDTISILKLVYNKYRKIFKNVIPIYLDDYSDFYMI